MEDTPTVQWEPGVGDPASESICRLQDEGEVETHGLSSERKVKGSLNYRPQTRTMHLHNIHIIHVASENNEALITIEQTKFFVRYINVRTCKEI